MKQKSILNFTVPKRGFVWHCNLKQTTFTTDHLDSEPHKRVSVFFPNKWDRIEFVWIKTLQLWNVYNLFFWSGMTMALSSSRRQFFNPIALQQLTAVIVASNWSIEEPPAGRIKSLLENRTSSVPNEMNGHPSYFSPLHMLLSHQTNMPLFPRFTRHEMNGPFKDKWCYTSAVNRLSMYINSFQNKQVWIWLIVMHLIL